MIPEQYIRSGKITREVKSVVSSRVKVGMSYLEACELVEKEIRDRGGKPAFPVGIGVNQVTAHYAPGEDDESVFRESDLIKVDFGVHVDGYVTDTAVSLTFNPDYDLMLDATQRALNVAISAAKSGARTGDIGGEVQKEASRFGFKTIQNLTGHTLDRYVVHAGKSIPNLYMPGTPSLRKGDVFAIEPFLTLGRAAGYVVDGPRQTIFSLVARKKTGSADLDAFVARVWDDRKTLPFTTRWYSDGVGAKKAKEIVSKLVAKRVMRAYQVLVEASGCPVAQFEHTMALDEGGLQILT
ncbi:MAG TPA: type II methionyl aminopeptidase [Nitrososphaerales archaeon]|nr:type II methionyl aminopeptidase [Nitrososphaerales archaeon]